MNLPLVRLTGTPYEQGLQHGRALRERIAHNLEVYFDRFEREGHVPRPEALDRARRYLAAIETQNADYAAGLRGIAEGSGFDVLEMTALNVRYEILYHAYTVEAMTEGCTSFAVAPQASANGHLLLGQNWDWVPEVLGAVLHTSDPDGTQTVAFTEAGIFGGKIGLNSAGLGLAVNGLISTDDDWSRLCRPFHVRCYEILRQRDLEAAAAVVTRGARACSTNYLMAQAPDRAADIEASPHRVRRLDWQDGILVHTNHFHDAEMLGVTEPVTDRRPYSCHRQERMSDLLAARRPVSIEDLQAYLRDHERHPNSVCRHPDTALPREKRTITVTSAIMDLEERRLWLTDLQPCLGEYQEFGL